MANAEKVNVGYFKWQGDVIIRPVRSDPSFGEVVWVEITKGRWVKIARRNVFKTMKALLASEVPKKVEGYVVHKESGEPKYRIIKMIRSSSRGATEYHTAGGSKFYMSGKQTKFFKRREAAVKYARGLLNRQIKTLAKALAGIR